jgi:hypothetical protein
MRNRALTRCGNCTTQATWEDCEYMLSNGDIYRKTGMSIWVDWVEMEVELEWELYEAASHDCPESGGIAYVNQILKIADFRCIDNDGNEVSKESLASWGISEDWIKEDILASVQIEEWRESQEEWAAEELERIYGDE